MVMCLSFGNNQHGQLGLGHCNNVNTPTLLMNDKHIKNIVCGNRCTIIYKDNGDIFAFGYIDSNTMSHRAVLLSMVDIKTKTPDNIPTFLINDINIRTIVSNGNDMIIYKDNGNIYKKSDCSLKMIKYLNNLGTLIMNDTYVKSINEIDIMRWSIENYKYLSIYVQKQIKIFYCCLKRIQNQKSIKIPKFVIYEILKFI